MTSRSNSISRNAVIKSVSLDYYIYSKTFYAAISYYEIKFLFKSSISYFNYCSTSPSFYCFPAA
nr:MAG TPA: hypothetical protein [Bacteriophage sp.]